jgi:8-oxo-dGTP diphosphatase
MSEHKEFRNFLRQGYQGPYSATDIIIRYNYNGKDGIILIDRLNEPHGLAWPGGMAEKIALPKNAIKEAKEETNLEVILDDPLRPFLVLSGVADDPREFISTNVYTAEGSGVLARGSDAKKVWHTTNEELYTLTQSKGLWAMERYRKIASLYLAHIGFEKAKTQADDTKKMILSGYEMENIRD